MSKYRITRDECQKKCDGMVCSTCGNPITPFETVDNSRNPTHWPGCEKCQKFNYGVPPEIYKKAATIKKDFHNVSIDDMCSIVWRLHADAQAVEREKDEELAWMMNRNIDLERMWDASERYAKHCVTTIEETEAALAAAQGEVEILRGEVRVKCKDCNRLDAFDENVRLREALGEIHHEITWAIQTEIGRQHGCNVSVMDNLHDILKKIQEAIGGKP